MTDGESLSAELKSRIFDAVRAELVAKGVDRFAIDGVSRRSGVDPGVIQKYWRDRRVLLMDAMLARTTAARWSPDTGSVRTDLDTVSAIAIDLSQNPEERALFRRTLPGDGDMDLAEIRPDLWDARFRDAAQILRRAADRGLLRDGVDADQAIRMFAAALFYDVIFSDRPVRSQYAEQVVDIFLNGVLSTAGRDRPWPDVDHLVGNPGDYGLGADQAVESARRAVVLMRVWADALIDPVVLYEAVRDDGGRVVDFVCRDLNRAACEEVGLPRSELLGRTLVGTMPNVESSGLIERYARCLESGEPLVLNDFSFLHFDQGRRLDLRATAAGPELITVTWRDVSERYESAQRDLNYRQLMDNSAVPAVLATTDGSIVSANQAMADLLGYDMATLLTKKWQDFTAPETIDEETRVVEEIAAGRRDTYRAIKQYLHADGHRICADLSVSCIRRSDGALQHMIAQIVDVTALLERLKETDSV